MLNQIDVDSIKTEEDALIQSTALNKIVVELLKDRKREALRSWIALIIACCVFMLSVIVLAYDAQRTKTLLLQQSADERAAFTSALSEERAAWIAYVEGLEIVTTDTITTTTETNNTIDQTVEGDGSDLINGNQYNDNATHNQPEAEKEIKKEG